jgi:hypothetical protein
MQTHIRGGALLRAPSAHQQKDDKTTLAEWEMIAVTGKCGDMIFR